LAWRKHTTPFFARTHKKSAAAAVASPDLQYATRVADGAPCTLLLECVFFKRERKIPPIIKTALNRTGANNETKIFAKQTKQRIKRPPLT